MEKCYTENLEEKIDFDDAEIEECSVICERNRIESMESSTDSWVINYFLNVHYTPIRTQ